MLKQSISERFLHKTSNKKNWNFSQMVLFIRRCHIILVKFDSEFDIKLSCQHQFWDQIMHLFEILFRSRYHRWSAYLEFWTEFYIKLHQMPRQKMIIFNVDTKNYFLCRLCFKGQRSYFKRRLNSNSDCNLDTPSYNFLVLSAGQTTWVFNALF